MRKLRERVPPARWRRFHFRICGLVICMILLYFGLEGSPLDLAPILIALALIVLDWVGCLLFFRCPACGAQDLDVCAYDTMLVVRPDLALFTLECPPCGASVSTL